MRVCKKGEPPLILVLEGVCKEGEQPLMQVLEGFDRKKNSLWSEFLIGF